MSGEFEDTNSPADDKRVIEAVEEAMESGALPEWKEFVREERGSCPESYATDEGLVLKQGDESIFITQEWIDSVQETLADYKANYC